MNSLDKFFDLCKYNQLDKAIDENASVFNSDKEKEFAKRWHHIFRDNNVPIEVAQKILKELTELYHELDEEYGE